MYSWERSLASEGSTGAQLQHAMIPVHTPVQRSKRARFSLSLKHAEASCSDDLGIRRLSGCRYLGSRATGSCLATEEPGFGTWFGNPRIGCRGQLDNGIIFEHNPAMLAHFHRSLLAHAVEGSGAFGVNMPGVAWCVACWLCFKGNVMRCGIRVHQRRLAC